MGNHPGSEAQILITGGGTNLGNIYAGSMNETYDGKTQIVLAHVFGTQNGEIYASGAIEPYVNQDDWFSTQEPDPPAADGQYTVSVMWKFHLPVPIRNRYTEYLKITQGRHF